MQYNLREKQFTVKYTNSETSVTLDFSSIKDIDSPILPNGVIAFIGKNGSGKSTALYKLAALLYADPSDRSRYMANVGVIERFRFGYIATDDIFLYSV